MPKLTPRRAPITGPMGQVEAFRAAMSRVAVPAHLRLPDEDRPYWEAVLASRAMVEWNDSDLAYAVQLARAYSDIDRLQRDIDREGDILPSGRKNPRHALVEMLTNRAIRLARLLQIHARARHGEFYRVAERREKYKTAADALRSSDDDLIPKD